MAEAGAATTGLSATTDKTTSAVGSKWKTAGAGISSTMGLSYAAVGVAAVGAAKYAVDAASNLEESINAVKVSYGDASTAVLDLGENATESFGLSQRAFNDAAVGFTNFAEDVAGDGGDVAGTLEDLMLRSTDFASVMNIDVTAAADAFKSALSGEAEPLKRFGINISDAAVKSHALATGIITAGEAMTDQEKVQARYSLLMKETDKVAGDFAKTSDGYAGAMKKAKAELENLAASFGKMLLPVLADALGGVTDLIGAWNALESSGPVQLVLEITGTEDDGLLGLGKKVLDEAKLWERPLEAIRDGLDKARQATQESTFAVIEYGGALEYIEAAIAEARGESQALSDTQDDLTSSTYLVQASIDAATEAMDRQTAAADKAREANMAMADGTYDLWDAESALYSAIEEANTILGDNEASMYDVRDALANVAINTDEVVTKQMELNGVTRDTVYGQQLWTEKMLTSAATLAGPMQKEVLAHIGRVNGIPEHKMTWILADADPNDLEQVRGELDALAASRTVWYTVAVNVSAAAALSGISVNPTGRHAGGPVRAGHLYEVGEGDVAEMFMANGRQYMIPGNDGQVIGGAGIKAGSGGSSSSLTINHFGPNLSAADVSRGYTLARLAQVA